MIGSRNRWAISMTPESAYGTPQATPTKSHPILGGRPRIIVDTVTDEAMMQGVLEEGVDSIPVGKRMEYGPELDAHPDAVAAYFKLAMGGISTSGAAPYTHLINVDQLVYPSFTGYWKGDEGQYQYPGCKIRRVTFRGSRGGNFKLVPEIIGNGEETNSVAVMPAISRELLIPFSSIGSFMVGGTEMKSRLNGVEITFESVIDEAMGQIAGQLTMADIARSAVRVAGKFDLLHKDKNYIDWIVAQSNKPVVLDIAPSAGTQIKFDIYRAFFADPNVSDGKGEQTHSPSFKGFYDATAGKAMQVTVKNATATYA